MQDLILSEEERCRVSRGKQNPLNVARALRDLARKYALNQHHLARQVGLRRSTVANYLRLLQLPPSIQESLQRDEISIGHAKIILSVADCAEQLKLHARIVQEALTVRQAEEAARGLLAMRDRGSDDLHQRALVEQLQLRLGTKVEIAMQGDRGQLILHYYDLDDLQRLLMQLGTDLSGN